MSRSFSCVISGTMSLIKVIFCGMKHTLGLSCVLGNVILSLSLLYFEVSLSF